MSHGQSDHTYLFKKKRNVKSKNVRVKKNICLRVIKCIVKEVDFERDLIVT